MIKINYHSHFPKNKKTQASLIILLSIFAMTGCCHKQTPSERTQNAALHLCAPPHKQFKQLHGDGYQPAAYVTCGEIGNPCPTVKNVGRQVTYSKKIQRPMNFSFKGENHENVNR